MQRSSSERLLRDRLLVAVGVITCLGLVVEVGAWSTPDAAWVELLWPRLSLSAEANVPTWFVSSLLGACAVVAGSIAAECPVGGPWRRHWWGIAIALGYVSLDEVATLHEHLGGHIGTGGVLYFDWVIWAAPVVVVLALVYLRFLRALPSPTRERLVGAAVIYVTGALVLELPLGWWTDRFGSDTFGYALIDWVEETLELLGASLALVALVGHRRRAP